MAYVGASEPPAGCIFCVALEGSDDRARLVLLRGVQSYLILNAFPYAPGHLMAVLKRHVGAVVDATAEELADVMTLVQRAVRALAEEYRAHGFNIGINQGQIAGAGIVDHLHVHVVPRWSGDTNFMPVIAHTTVLPEALADLAAKLRAAIAK